MISFPSSVFLISAPAKLPVTVRHQPNLVPVFHELAKLVVLEGVSGAVRLRSVKDHEHHTRLSTL